MKLYYGDKFVNVKHVNITVLNYHFSGLMQKPPLHIVYTIRASQEVYRQIQIQIS